MLPFFSSIEKARACDALRDKPGIEIAMVKPSELMAGQRGITFGLDGPDRGAVSEGVIHLVLDPQPADPNWGSVNAAAHETLRRAALEGACAPITISIGALEHVFVWRKPLERSWLP